MSFLLEPPRASSHRIAALRSFGAAVGAAYRGVWSEALDRVAPGRVEARTLATARAACAAVSAVPPERFGPLEPVTHAAHRAGRTGRAAGTDEPAGAAAGVPDDVPSMLLGDDVLSRASNAASRYLLQTYGWAPGRARDAAWDAWPDAEGRVRPAAPPGAAHALRRDLLAVALARLVAWDATGDAPGDAPGGAPGVVRFGSVGGFDLREFSGLTAANAPTYPSLAAFGDEDLLPHAEYRARYGRAPSVGFETVEEYARALDGLRGVLGPQPWAAYRQAWDGRLFLANHDGAHRLAAVHRYCREQDAVVPVWARVTRVALAGMAAAVVGRDFAIWRVAPSTYDALADALEPAGVRPVLDGVYRRERGYGFHPAPSADPAAVLFALPADHWATPAVRARLRAARGAAFDLSRHVRACAADQAARERGRA